MKNQNTKRRTFSALAAVALAVVFTTTAHAVTTVTVTGPDVTFTTDGTFSDNGTYTFTAEFTQAALLDDWNVFPAEATRFEMAVTEGTDTGFPAVTWTKANLTFPGDIALVFSGVVASPVFEHLFNASSNRFGWRKPFPFGPFVLIASSSAIVQDTRPGIPSIFRDAPQPHFPFGPLAVHPVDPPPAVIPEPLTTGLAAMGVTSLMMSLRRRRRA